MSAELVREWVKKAEEDWVALSRLRRGGVAEVADVITFHAQQCGEKYLKALIQKEGREPPRTHHLPTLLDLLVPSYPDLEALRVSCEGLTPYAILYRYPGGEAGQEDAEEAVRHAEKLRAVLRKSLGI